MTRSAGAMSDTWVWEFTSGTGGLRFWSATAIMTLIGRDKLQQYGAADMLGIM